MIETNIDLTPLSKPWLTSIPKQCGYDKLIFDYSKEPYQNKPIEKNIHFIWIGSPVPEKYALTVVNCQRINPHYTVFFWIDEHTTITLPVVMKQVSEIKDESLDKLNNYGFKADILRLHIVYKYGGIYSDVDSVWLKPLDENFDYEFVAYRNDVECRDIGNPFFGFSNNSIILSDILRNLGRSVDCILKINNHYTICAHIPVMTGGGLLSKVIMENHYDSLHYIHQKWCVIGGPHERIYSEYSKTGKSYCYQTFDNNWGI